MHLFRYYNNVKLITESKKETTIPINQYKAVIFNYADKIKTFYSKSLPKEFSY